MRAVQSTSLRFEHETLIVAVVTRLAALYKRLPTLIGFSVQERTTVRADRVAAAIDEELSVADVSLHPWLASGTYPDVCAEIAGTLLELLEEYPAARALLRGQTFARSYH